MNCTLGEPFLNNTSFKLIVTTQALLSAMALVINPVILRTVYCKMYFHKNIRMLLGLGVIMNIVHSFFYVIMQGMHSYLMFTAETGCDLMVPAVFCNTLRIPAWLSMMCYTSINNSMVFERFIATIKVETYEDISTVFGIVLSIIALAGAVIIGSFIVMGPIASDYVPYCALLNNGNARQITWSSLLGSVAEISVLLTFIALFYANKWMEKNKRYNMKIRFQVRENLAVCRTLAPWLILHFATIIFMFSSTYVIPMMVHYEIYIMEARTLLAACYIMPLFCVLSPLALKTIYRREQVKRRAGIKNISRPVTSEEYHLIYTAGWDKK